MAGTARVGRRDILTPMAEQICRYCKEPFDLKPGKPGYADECPVCLHEKTTPKTVKTRSVTPEELADREKIYRRYNRLSRKVLAQFNPSLSKERLDEQAAKMAESLMKDLFQPDHRH